MIGTTDHEDNALLLHRQRCRQIPPFFATHQPLSRRDVKALVGLKRSDPPTTWIGEDPIVRVESGNRASVACNKGFLPMAMPIEDCLGTTDWTARQAFPGTVFAQCGRSAECVDSMRCQLTQAEISLSPHAPAELSVGPGRLTGLRSVCRVWNA